MESMRVELENYIAACEVNIASYKSMEDVDYAAIAAAESMREQFQVMLQQLESAMEYE